LQKISAAAERPPLQWGGVLQWHGLFGRPFSQMKFSVRRGKWKKRKRERRSFLRDGYTAISLPVISIFSLSPFSFLGALTMPNCPHPLPLSRKRARGVLLEFLTLKRLLQTTRVLQETEQWQGEQDVRLRSALLSSSDRRAQQTQRAVAYREYADRCEDRLYLINAWQRMD
jgi:hypothetical protein